MSGLVWYFYREKITIVIATLISIGLGIVHIILLILLTPNNFGWYLVTETPTGIGIVTLVALSVLIFSWCYQKSKQLTAKKE